MPYQAASDRYNVMEYRRCGKSGLKLPLLSLGLWHNFGGVDSLENAREMLVYAFDRGVTHFDLGNNYGPPPGSAEETFGRILRSDLKPYRDQMIVSTKAGYTMWPGPYGDWGSRKYLLASLDQSLCRMGVEYVDIFYSHRFDPETPLEETLSALDHAVRQGKAIYAGISNYPPAQTRKAAAILESLGTPCLIHQARYSMLDRWVEEDLLSALEMCGIGCIAFSPLAQGLLSDRYLNGIPSDSRAAKEHGFLRREQVDEATLRPMTRLNALAGRRGQTLAQMALAWVVRNPVVTSVLIGASSVGQLEDNLGFLQQLEFSSDEEDEIEGILSCR